MAVKKRKQAKSTQWPKVYIGPTRRGGALSHLQTFANGYPPHVQNLIDRHPLLSQLFVRPAELSQALKDLEVKGTLYHSIFNKLKTELGGL